MRIVPTALLAGVASIALTGIAVAHTLTVRLPDGTTEQIEYSGNVAPQVSFVPAASVAVPDWAVGPSAPFALMQQISAEMDRETAAMMRQMQAMAAQPLLTAAGQPIAISATNLPPGAESYSFVSTVSPNGFCSQSMQITSNGPGRKPQVVTRRSGNCGPAGAAGATNAAAPDETPATMPARPRADTYHASAAGNPAYARMFHQASW